ncbi:MAG: helix-turn-helix domain-containing protein [Thermoplasmata archaeon]|nr:helix-turn-helix domain-containing protein [Thermoplasmata archaeon]
MLEKLAEKMAGEIVLSESPGRTIRKWRETFKVSQKELAKELGVSPSTICDYEHERRESPGIKTISRIVNSIINIDRKRGGDVLKKYTIGVESDAIIQIREFPIGIPLTDFKDVLGAKNVSPCSLQRDIHGYTIVDSVKAILSLNATDYLKIYGWSTERALIFTDVRYGRSPMVAIRVHPLKPACVVLHAPKELDPLAIKIAELENIPLLVTKMNLNDLIKKLEEL